MKIADLAKVVDLNPYFDYANIIEEAQKCNRLLSDKMEFKLVDKKPEVTNDYHSSYISGNYWVEEKGKYTCYYIDVESEQAGGYSYERKRNITGFTIRKVADMVFDKHNPEIKILVSKGKSSKLMTPKEFNDMNWKNMTLKKYNSDVEVDFVVGK